SIKIKNAPDQGKWIHFATYGYDDRGNLVSVRDAAGHSARFDYDDAHRLTTHTDRAGLAFHFIYDREGRCVESWGDYPGDRDPSLAASVPDKLADGARAAKGVHHCRITYADDYTEAVDSLQVRRFFSNRFGTADKVIDGGFVTSFEHDDNGFMVGRQDAEGAVTRWTRDQRGRVTAMIDALGRETQITRDERGDIAKVVDPAGGVTLSQRDPNGNLKQVVDALETITNYTYDDRGLWVAMVHPNGGKTALERDAHGNPVVLTIPNGQVWRWSYDHLGRPASETDPTGAEERYTYNDRGDRTAVYRRNGNVTRFEYDGEGRPVRVVQPDGHCVEVTWGGLNRLCSRKDPSGGIVTLKYDREGEIVELINERGQVHSFEYDVRRQLVGETTFTGAKRRLSRDGLGRVTRVEDGNGDITDYAYDPVGNIVEKIFADDTAEQFEYDARDYLLSATSAAGEFAFERDRLGRVIRESQTVDGTPHHVDLVRDALGMVVERSTSLGHQAIIRRDAAGTAIETVLDGEIIKHESDGLGRELVRRLARGGTIETDYDKMGRIARKTVLGPSPAAPDTKGQPDWIGPKRDGSIADTAYQYDANEELIGAWDTAQGSVGYEYDPLGQLTAAVPENARGVAFRYDEAGNVASGGEEAVFDQGNQLVKKGNTFFEWDAEGRLTKKTVRDLDGTEHVTRYEWDAAGLLAKVTTPDEKIVAFRYDPFARRVQKRVLQGAVDAAPEPVSDTRFVYCDDQLVHELKRAAQAAGDPVVEERTYAFEDNAWTPLAQRVTTKTGNDEATDVGPWHHYVNDFIGAPLRLVSSAGAIACELERTPWGKAKEKEGAKTTTPFRLPGQYADDETGLSYNRARYFDPDLGRFISFDPLGLLGGTNGFAFRFNPTHWIDPLGEAGMVAPGSNQMQDVPGSFMVNAHGNPQGMQMNGGFTTDPTEIARQIRADPGYTPGTPIILNSCSTGAGSNSIAQQLSNEMGVPVTAPTQTVWNRSDGSTTFENASIQENNPSNPDPGATGEWRTSTPSLWSRVRRFFGGGS
ncbi:MAG: RHS repeat protein, partial [Deltaproteobacteria bacterium]|nr:RHS repeat protein [Deltaproteobacteria bacterium]